MSVNSESPFYEVLDEWGYEVIELNKDLDSHFKAVEMNHGFTLKSGMQVSIKIGKDILDQND